MSEEQARIELLKRYAERVAELGAENARLREALLTAADDLLDGDYETRAGYAAELRAALAAKGAE